MDKPARWPYGNYNGKRDPYRPAFADPAVSPQVPEQSEGRSTNVIIMPDADLRPAAERYLRNHIGASLFGRAYEIPESMSKAVDFIVETMEGVLKAAEEIVKESQDA